MPNQMEDSKGAHLVGKAPEEKGDDNRSPELGHDVEQAEAPIPQDGNGRRSLAPGRCQQPFAECCMMYEISELLYRMDRRTFMRYR